MVDFPLVLLIQPVVCQERRWCWFAGQPGSRGMHWNNCDMSTFISTNLTKDRVLSHISATGHTIGSLQGFRLLLSRKFGSVAPPTCLKSSWHGTVHCCSKLKKHAAPFPFGRWQAAAWRVSLDPDGNGHISFGPLSWDVHATERLPNLGHFDDEQNIRK